MVDYLNIEKAKISVIPPPISEHFKQIEIETIEQFAQHYKLDRNCKWMMISGQEFYKNHRASLQVLRKLNAKQGTRVKLLKTGLPSKEFDQLAETMGVSNLVTTVYLENTIDMGKAYNFVDCLLFPSLYEGFGMPVAEALACGTPVVTSDRGSLPEVAGELAESINPFDIKRLSWAVYQVLFQDDASQKVAAHGAEWVKQYRPDNIASQLEQVYERMLSNTS